MVWASRAPAVIDSAVEAPAVVIVSAVKVPAIDNERWTSAASVLMCSAASEAAVTRVFWASRAPATIDPAVEVPTADSVRSTSAARFLNWLGGGGGGVPWGVC